MARRSKKKRVLNGAPFLWLTALNVLIGLRYSPFFCLRRVHVYGAQKADEATIVTMFDPLMDRAAVGINGAEVETNFQSLPEVERCSFGANVFGSGRLECRYRKPVGCIVPRKLGLDISGHVWKTRQPLDGLPTVFMPAESLTAELGLAHVAPFAAIATLCTKLHAAYPQFAGDIVLDDAGSLCLNRKDSGSIVLGGPEALDEKLTRLSALLHDKSDLFKGAVEVNLTAPSHPVFRRISKQHDENPGSP